MIVLITLALVLVTMTLALIAKYQIDHIVQVNKVNVLFQIMQEYMGERIVQARVMIKQEE